MNQGAEERALAVILKLLFKLIIAELKLDNL